MEAQSIYKDIAKRTGGDIYIGVVGPVRTGKSTFIKRFMETLVIPNIGSEFVRERATDELPQSAAGRTIMTTEPKFIPEEAVKISLGENTSLNVRMIDCVGYIVPSSLGYIENDQPRMVVTPWFDKEIPFNMAAEIGTQKVINEHSTIGLVVTTDGSISDIPRSEYAEAEERVVNELQGINKPFVVLLNCVNPSAPSAISLRAELEEKYSVPVVAVNCMDLSDEDIKLVLADVLFQFPVREVAVTLPGWVTALAPDHWLRSALYSAIHDTAADIAHIGELNKKITGLNGCEYVSRVLVDGVDLGSGCAKVSVDVPNALFYQILGEATGLEIPDESALMPCIIELAQMKKEYDKVKSALDEVAATGYGIVMPGLEELTLEEPEIVKQGGRYGVRLKASAPSIHMMSANITTEVSPIVGSEKQSEELVHYLLHEFEESPQKIWESNIFGTSLHELVNQGLHNKLYRMPGDARLKLQETIERIINDGCTGLICIIL
ncbi:stage IV sporulation protein A [Anaerotruncus rubiinfantis]|jgi:stage IV sporulation protein A|uniref:stage IV sporulation protein A n=1 Tax=Anaerotruncus rubiinfantis TaxID=1720200 RepID=UPI00082EACA0|nr:stage IV sporulation protein A [Anaerotruncus rubiinfantis]